MSESPHIDNAMALIIEEAGEVLQAIGKIQRFGLFNRHPAAGSSSNLTELQKECLDLRTVLDIFFEMTGIPEREILEHKVKKIEKIDRWAHKK